VPRGCWSGRRQSAPSTPWSPVPRQIPRHVNRGADTLAHEQIWRKNIHLPSTWLVDPL
jgi:hypothetical protein